MANLVLFLFSLSVYVQIRFTPKVGLKKVTSIERHIRPFTNELKQGNDVIKTRTQLPLRLSYALTIHKAQGQTLPSVEVRFKISYFLSTFIIPDKYNVILNFFFFFLFLSLSFSIFFRQILKTVHLQMVKHIVHYHVQQICVD